MRISDGDQTYVMQKTLITGACFGAAFTACLFGGLMRSWGMGFHWVPLVAGIGVYIVGEIFHRKAMDRVIEAREAEP